MGKGESKRGEGAGDKPVEKPVVAQGWADRPERFPNDRFGLVEAAHSATNAALGVTRYKRRRLRDRGFGRLAARNRPTGVLIPRAGDTEPSRVRGGQRERQRASEAGVGKGTNRQTEEQGGASGERQRGVEGVHAGATQK